jgi:uncharacterized protein YjiS (DUF1127 family)
MEDAMSNPIQGARRADLPRLGDSVAYVLRFGRSFADAIAQYFRNRLGERRLSEMSDYQLRDIGITRGDIRRVAWQREA